MEVVEVLLKHGGEVHFKDAEGNTAGDVVGEDIDEDTRRTVHDLLRKHATKKRASTAERDPRTSITSPTTAGEPQSSDIEGSTTIAAVGAESRSSDQLCRLPNLGSTPLGCHGELSREGLGTETDDQIAVLSSTLTVASRCAGGGTSVRSGRSGRSSFSAAPHIRVSSLVRWVSFFHLDFAYTQCPPHNVAPYNVGWKDDRDRAERCS